PLVGQRDKKLDREERIAAGLLLPKLRQWPRTLRLTAERVGDEPSNIVEPEGRQHDLVGPRINRADHLPRPQKRVRRADLVVPVGPDQQQVPHLWMRDQMLEEAERCSIQPLQIIEKQG